MYMKQAVFLQTSNAMRSVIVDLTVPLVSISGLYDFLLCRGGFA